MGYVEGQNHRILKSTGKSGLTPLSPFAHNEWTADRANLHFYQQSRFKGFSAAELEKMQALTALETRTVKPNLGNPIHPIYALPNWATEASLPATLGPIPIRGDHEGYWLV